MSELTKTEPPVTRESSPERLLSIFETVSGMKPADKLTTTDDPTISREAKLGQVIGAIVIGSCTDPESTPKDLDILVVLAGDPNPRAQEYVEELIQAFAFENGCLDTGGGFVNKDLHPKGLHPVQLQALRETKRPLVFAFKKSDADYILDKLRANFKK